MKIDKDIYQNKSEKISLKREINSSNSKKSLNIQYEYNKVEDDIKVISVYQILLLGFIDFLQSLSFFYGNNLNDYQMYFWSSHIFFLCLSSKFLLIIKFYRHYIFSFILFFFFFDVIHILFVFIDKEILYNKIQFYFLLINSICFSFELIYEKKLMEKHFISPYKLCFLVGFSSLFYNIVYYLLCK